MEVFADMRPSLVLVVQCDNTDTGESRVRNPRQCISIGPLAAGATVRWEQKCARVIGI